MLLGPSSDGRQPRPPATSTAGNPDGRQPRRPAHRCWGMPRSTPHMSCKSVSGCHEYVTFGVRSTRLSQSRHTATHFCDMCEGVLSRMWAVLSRMRGRCCRGCVGRGPGKAPPRRGASARSKRQFIQVHRLRRLVYARLAQLVAHLTCNEAVVGSSPTAGLLAEFRTDGGRHGHYAMGASEGCQPAALKLRVTDWQAGGTILLNMLPVSGSPRVADPETLWSAQKRLPERGLPGPAHD